MSFAGHVFDMIRRDKENREMKNRRREKNKDRRDKSLKSDIASYDPDITLEEFEEINRQIKERELVQKHNSTRIGLLIMGSILVLLILVWVASLFL